MYVLDLEKTIVNGVWEGSIGRANRGTIQVFTDKRLTGTKINNFYTSGSTDDTRLKVFGEDGLIYITYETIELQDVTKRTASSSPISSIPTRVLIDETNVEKILDRVYELEIKEGPRGEKGDPGTPADLTEIETQMGEVTAQLAETATDLDQREVNVRQPPFNAPIGENTDATESIKSAIAYCKTNGIGKLYLPSGLYYIDFVLKVDFDLQIRGESRSTTKIKLKNQSTLFHNPTRNNTDRLKTNLDNLYRDYHALIFVDDCNFTISGIELDGNPSNQTDVVGGIPWNYVAPGIGGGGRNYYKYVHGIHFLHKTISRPKWHVEDCHIHGMSWNNVDVGNNNEGSHIEADVVIRDNILGTAGQDIVSIHRVKGAKVYNNKIINPNSHGIHPYYDASDVDIIDNTFINNHQGKFIFAPNSPTAKTTFIVIGHSDYPANRTRDVLIDHNRMYVLNSPADVLVTGIEVGGKGVSAVKIIKNKMRGVYQGINIWGTQLSLENQIIDNDIEYLDQGVSFRPFSGTGFLGISDSLDLPTKTKWTVDKNYFYCPDQLKFAIDLSIFGTVSKSVVDSYEVIVGENEGNRNILNQSNQFTYSKQTRFTPNELSPNFHSYDGDAPVGWLGRYGSNAHVAYTPGKVAIEDVDGVRKYFDSIKVDAAKLPDNGFGSVTYKEKILMTPGEYLLSFYIEGTPGVLLSITTQNSKGQTDRIILNAQNINIVASRKLFEYRFKIVDETWQAPYFVMTFRPDDITNLTGSFSLTLTGLKLEKTSESKRAASATKSPERLSNELYTEQTKNELRTKKPLLGVYKLGDTVHLEPSVGNSVARWKCTTAGTLNNTPWTANTSAVVGRTVNANGNVYRSTVVGTTGTVAPSHTSATATDGTVVWEYVDKLGVLTEEGILGAKKIATQAASAASDIPGVVADLNALITKLKNAGLMI